MAVAFQQWQLIRQRVRSRCRDPGNVAVRASRLVPVVPRGPSPYNSTQRVEAVATEFKGALKRVFSRENIAYSPVRFTKYAQ